VNLNDFQQFKNLKSLEVVKEDGQYYVNITSSSNIKYKEGDKVVIERGNLVFCGELVSPNKVKVSNTLINMLNRKIPNWNLMPGYIIRKDNPINLLSGEQEKGQFNIELRGNNYIYITLGEEHFSCQLPIKLKCNRWYGLIINFGSTFNASVFEADGELKKVGEVSNVKFKLDLTGTYTSYAVKASACKMTNIRYFNREMLDLDKQIVNLVSYNITENGDAIVNDSADIFIGRENQTKYHQ
jgi:hypothetical protein